MEPFGKFELLASLARGGMAEVFLARQRGEGRFERLVVIKRILPVLADDPRFVEMFLEEARIAALLDHPNVVPIYDFGREDDSFFIAMPFVHGLSVRRLIKQARKRSLSIPLEVATEVVHQALRGLHYAHERTGLDGQRLDLVHRDVSPSNLMINEQGRVQLLDFGIASVSDSANTDSGSLRGKISYMSPEQVRAVELDRRSDLFSLGIVFWELLVGTYLFKRPSQTETMHAIGQAPVPDPREHRSDLPDGVVSVLLRALEQDADLRYATAEEMRLDLEAASVALGLPTGEPLVRDYLHRGFGDLLDVQDRKVREVQDVDPDEDIETVVAGPKRAPMLVLTGSAPELPPRRRLRWRWLVGAALLLLLLAGGSGALLWHARRGPVLEGPPVTLGMTPYMPDEVLRREWAPLVDYLQRKTGRPFVIEVSLNYESAAEALASGAVDVADLPAYPFIVARQQDPGIEVLAMPVRHEATSYESYLVVRRDDAARKLLDLRGRRVCYVDRTSSSGYLMPRLVVRRAGLDPDEFFSSAQFSANHVRALRDLLAERCDVAAVTSSAYDSAEEEGVPASKLRIIDVSPPVPHGVFCASSKVDPGLVGQLRAALIGFDSQRDLGRETLSKVLPITGFEEPDLTVFEELAREVQ